MQMVDFKKQHEFPSLKEYKTKFPITASTIFVFEDTIYSNLTEKDFCDNYYDVLAHELEHIRQQKIMGAKEWVKKYLKYPKFRLKEELGAYREQMRVVKNMNDQEEYRNILTECANNISSKLYGEIIDYNKAYKLLTLDNKVS